MAPALHPQLPAGVGALRVGAAGDQGDIDPFPFLGKRAQQETRFSFPGNPWWNRRAESLFGQLACRITQGCGTHHGRSQADEGNETLRVRGIHHKQSGRPVRQP